MLFFFSSRRRHTRCALVTGVQTCALPICGSAADHLDLPDRERAELVHLVAGALAQGFVDRHAVDQDRRGPPADVRRAVAACLALRRERSEERRVGKECVSTCRSRWWPYPSKKNNTNDKVTKDK